MLVTTPLAVSIKQAIPEAAIDYLVFEGTEGVLEKNPHVRRTITVPQKGRNIGLLLSLFRSYDVAFAAYPSDRTFIAAAIAGKRSIGLSYHHKKRWWQRFALDTSLSCDDRFHVVPNILSLLTPLDIPSVPRVTINFDADDIASARKTMPAEKYIILHPFSRNRCKYWPAEKWGELARLIQEDGECRAVFTRTPSSQDSEFLEKILAVSPHDTIAFSTSYTLSQLAAVIRRCTAFVGIDTAVTHIAAAVAAPTIALFGPSLTRYWAPWLNGCVEQSPFAANKGIQRKGCVTVVQKDWECVPCNRETCAISTRGRMECMEALTADEAFRGIQECVDQYHSRP